MLNLDSLADLTSDSQTDLSYPIQRASASHMASHTANQTLSHTASHILSCDLSQPIRQICQRVRGQMCQSHYWKQDQRVQSVWEAMCERVRLDSTGRGSPILGPVLLISRPIGLPRPGALGLSPTDHMTTRPLTWPLTDRCHGLSDRSDLTDQIDQMCHKSLTSCCFFICKDTCTLSDAQRPHWNLPDG